MEVMDLAGRGCVEVASSRSECLYPQPPPAPPPHNHPVSGLDDLMRMVGEGSPGRGVDLCGWCGEVRGREEGGC